MRRIGFIAALGLLLAVGLLGCAASGMPSRPGIQASEEDRCTRSGGTWRGTFCETREAGY